MPGKVPMISRSCFIEWWMSPTASTFRIFSAPESVSGIANEPRFGVPSITRRPPRPAPVVSSIAFHVAGCRWANRRETRPPIEWATRCTGSPAPNAVISASSRAALLSMSSRQSKGNGRTCQRVSSSSRIGTYVSWWSPAGRTWIPAFAGSPSGVSSRSPIRPARRRTKSIQIRSTSPLRSTESSSVPMIPGRTRTFPSLPAAATARRRPARTLERLRAQPLLEEVGLATVDREQRAADAVEVAAVERGLQLVDARGLGRAHRPLPEQGAPTTLRDRCAAASALGEPPNVTLLSAVLLPSIILHLALLSRSWPPRRWAAGRRPRRSRGSSPRGSRTGARRSSRAGSRGR